MYLSSLLIYGACAVIHDCDLIGVMADDFHRPGGRRTPAWIRNRKKNINDLIKDKASNHAQIGLLLHAVYGDRLPKTNWAKEGIKLDYDTAKALRSASQHPGPEAARIDARMANWWRRYPVRSTHSATTTDRL
jgi:hypothetical protein